MTKSDGWGVYLTRGTSDIGLVLVHEWWGLTPYVKRVADQLASNGYSAAAVDMYKGTVATTPNEAMAMTRTVKREDIIAGIKAGVDLLKSSGVKKIGTMGFCMGGGFALLGACNSEDVSFCVDYYGSIENADELNNLKGPMILILGSDDERISSWAFSSGLPAAMKYKKKVSTFLYPNARHAFHNSDGQSYNPEAAADAWSRTLEFLARLR